MLRVLMAILLVVCLAPRAGGEPAPPTVRNTTIGFAGQFPNRHWTRLRVDVINPGPARTLRIVAEVQGTVSRQLTTYTRPVWLPAQARRSVSFPVYTDIDENPPDKKPGERRIDSVFSVKLTDGGLRVWDRQTVYGRAIPEEALFVLVADQRQTSYRFHEEQFLGGTKRPIARSVLRPDALPSRAVEYDGVSMVVLGELGDQRLSALQTEALRAWVRAGGVLVFAPGPTVSDDWIAEWEAFLPVSYFGPDRIATEPQFRRWGTAPLFSEGLSILRMAVHRGQIIAGSAAAPLAVTRPVGLGMVIALGFDAGDLQFQKWPGAPNFQGDLLQQCAHVRPNADRILEHSSVVDRLMSSLAGIKVLSRGAVLTYLIAVVAGLLGLLGAYRFTRAPERGWWVGATAALVVGAITMVAATRWKSQPQPFLNEIGVAFVAPDGQCAALHAGLGLYSPWAANYSLTTPSVRPGPSQVAPPERIGFEYEDRLRLTDFATRAQDMRVVYGQALLTAGPYPQAALHLGASGLRVELHNPGAEPFEDCFVKLNRLVVPLGHVAPGQTLARDNLRGSEPGADTRYSTRSLRNADDERRQRLRTLFFPDPVYILGSAGASLREWLRARSLMAQWPVALCGWSRRAHFPVTELDARVARRAEELWILRPTVTVDGPRVLLPKGVLPLRLKNKEAQAVERAEGRFSGTRATTIVAEFGLPAECPDLQIETAQVFLEFRGSAFRCTVPEMAEPLRAYDPVTRSITLHLTIEPVASGPPVEAAVNYWQIRDLDLEVGGTIR